MNKIEFIGMTGKNNYDVIGYDGYSIGDIYYYKKWKKLIFEPMSETIYDSNCLKEIAEFLRSKQ